MSICPSLGWLYLRVLNQPRPRLLAVSFVVSALFSLTTPTDLYFVGHYRYPRGHACPERLIFQFFGVFSFAVIGYSLVAFAKQLRRETIPF